jgi:hypothetical protein
VPCRKSRILTRLFRQSGSADARSADSRCFFHKSSPPRPCRISAHSSVSGAPTQKPRLSSFRAPSENPGTVPRIDRSYCALTFSAVGSDDIEPIDDFGIHDMRPDEALNNVTDLRGHLPQFARSTGSLPRISPNVVAPSRGIA